MNVKSLCVTGGIARLGSAGLLAAVSVVTGNRLGIKGSLALSVPVCLMTTVYQEVMNNPTIDTSKKTAIAAGYVLATVVVVESTAYVFNASYLDFFELGLTSILVAGVFFRFIGYQQAQF